MLIKPLVIFLILLLSPVLFLYLYRKVLPIWVISISSIYFIALLAIAIPLGNFAYTIFSVNYTNSDACRNSIEVLNRYQDNRITRCYDESLIIKMFGLHPDIYTHSSLAICDYMTGNYIASKNSLDKLLFYDESELDKYVDTNKLNSLRMKVESKLGNMRQRKK